MPAAQVAARHPKLRVGQSYHEPFKATVKGNFIVALIQGTVGGTAFWALAIKGALLWCVTMVILSLLPANRCRACVGTDGSILAAVRRVRPRVSPAGHRSAHRQHDRQRPPAPARGQGHTAAGYLALISTLGGLALFGMDGFVIGPLIAALFVAVWSLPEVQAYRDGTS